MRIVESLVQDQDYDTARLTITIDGVRVFGVRDGEPEDNTLGRNFEDCFLIKDLLIRMYEAGVAGEPLDVESERLTR